MSKTTYHKTTLEVRPYDCDITKIIEDNSAKEMQAIEDEKFIRAVEAGLPLREPYWRWHEDAGIVHMTGVRRSGYNPADTWRETRCGLLLNPRFDNYPVGNDERPVTCLECLGQ